MVNLFPPCRVPTYRVYGDVPVLMLVRKSFPRRALPRRVNDTSLIGCGDWIMKAKVRRMAVVSTTLRVGAKPVSDLPPLKSQGPEALGSDPPPPETNVMAPHLELMPFDAIYGTQDLSLGSLQIYPKFLSAHVVHEVI